ncbi:MAG: ABC transporter ATP-binding protein [Anaerolineales bacterium]|nr:ABC transporter ATP-binding protein [Anaerolineales bacterium]MCW5855454.1 ABC transporter ATP-binding protein [Anaerolineales bacterium]
MATNSLPAHHAAEFTLPERYPTNRSGPLPWLFSRLWHYWPLTVMLLLGALSNGALATYVPVIIGDAYEAITQTPARLDILGQLVVTLLVSQIIRSGLQFARNFGAEWLGQLFERDVREELYVNLLGKSMTFHSLQSVGDTMARATNDVREINLMFNPGLNLVIGASFFLFGPIAAAYPIHPQLVLTPLLFTIAYALAIWRYLVQMAPLTREVRESFGALNSRLSEALDGIETVKGMSQEEGEVSLFARNVQRFRDAFVQQGYLEARFLPMLLMGLAQAAGLWHSLALYQQGQLLMGDVIAYFGLLQLFGFPVFTSLFAYSQVSLGVASAARILDLMNNETDLDQNVSGRQAKMTGEIEFRNVTFAYEDDDPAVEGISFKVPAGQTVAIVGQTGVGKTTLAKLVNRTYDVTSGAVLVDGVDVREWNLESLRLQISIIEQDIFLFSRSLADNIAFGVPNASRADIEQAAKLAQAHDFIMEFKNGYDTIVGDRGVTLSGGQRQRVALARAFLTDPAVLILDDSTSAIDSATEDMIQRAIYAAAKDRTTLIITHRLSQIRWADQIVVLRGGKVAAAGSHDDLMKTSPAYRRIFSE